MDCYKYIRLHPDVVYPYLFDYAHGNQYRRIEHNWKDLDDNQNTRSIRPGVSLNRWESTGYHGQKSKVSMHFLYDTINNPLGTGQMHGVD